MIGTAISNQLNEYLKIHEWQINEITKGIGASVPPLDF